MVKVIGIGASAGGLEAFLAFFRTIKNEKLAYIIVQHLSEKTSLDTLLQHDASQKIVHAKNGQVIKQNHIYLNSPDHILRVEDQKIVLEKAKGPDIHYPINTFFKSLAKTYQDKAIAVILSGTGTDGTLGAIDIKSAGGLVLAQDPKTAQFNGMPYTVINNSAADYISSPENLAKFINTLRLQETKLTGKEEHYLPLIIEHVEKVSKINFSAYKEPTLSRRIKRRMQLLKIAEHEEYLSQVGESKKECLQLRREFLIPVTSFFRDPEIFSYLEQNVIPKIVQKAHEEHRLLRIWIIGCSIGSEAYSLGILIEEIRKALKIELSYKIFASDVDNEAIFRANEGIYTHSEVSNLPKEYLPIYFKQLGDKKVQVQQSFKEHFLFINHDLLADPPLINMDMVSCRNLLIYFKKEFQINLLKKFCFSLNNSGILLLGKSESVSGLEARLAEVDKHAKVYEVLKQDRTSRVGFVHGKYRTPDTSKLRNQLKIKEKKNLLNATEMNSSENIYDLLLQEIIPNYIVVDEDFEIIYNNVDIKGFFALTKGSPTLNLLKMVTPELSLILRKGVKQVLEEMQPLRLEAVEIESANEKEKVVDILLKPLSSRKITKKVILMEMHPLKDATPAAKSIDYSRDSIIRSLKQELEDTKRNLLQLEAKLEASNEELQSTNEELQSSNEELQSSNEELQSLNEELYSVNSELQERMKELSQLNEESNQLIEGAELGMVVIDQHSFVLKYTKTAKKLFDLNDENPGKNIFSLEKNFEMADFPQFINDGFKTNNIYEKEVKTFDGDFFTMRRIPLNNRLILLFLDINRVKDINQLYQIIFENSNDFVYIFDQGNRIKLANKFALENWNKEKTVGSSVLDFITEDQKRNEVESNLRRMFKDGEPYEYYLKTHDSAGKKYVFLCKTHLIKQTKGSLGVLVSRDVTHEVQLDAVLESIASKVANIILVVDENEDIVSLKSNLKEFQTPAPPVGRRNWTSAFKLYNKDGSDLIPETENPLTQACKGVQSEKFELHLAYNDAAEKLHLWGDFYPIRYNHHISGAIAYFHKA